MESDIELAIHHASDLARSRGGRLAAIHLCGGGSPKHVEQLARSVCARLDIDCAEICCEAGAGRVRLLFIEVTA